MAACNFGSETISCASERAEMEQHEWSFSRARMINRLACSQTKARANELLFAQNFNLIRNEISATGLCALRHSCAAPHQRRKFVFIFVFVFVFVFEFDSSAATRVAGNRSQRSAAQVAASDAIVTGTQKARLIGWLRPTGERASERKRRAEVAKGR